jgi:hypothetical protein
MKIIFIFGLSILSSCNFFKNVTGTKPNIPKDFVPTENTPTNLIIDREAPFQILKIYPNPNSSYNQDIIIQVYGVEIGDQVYVYNDSSCTSELINDQATSDVIEFTINSLSLGNTNIYSRIINGESASPCSTAFVSYTRLSCPSDYVLVPYDLTAGTNMDFCAAKFEMKNVGGIATSQPSGSPWVNVTQTNAKSLCQSLGANYDLISNIEWMTIARNIDAQNDNWTDGISGSGILYRGHSDNSPAALLSVSNVNDFYDGTGNSFGSGTEQLRVHRLSNNEEIWDLSGNALEWVDWNINTSSKAYRSTDGVPTAAFIEFYDLDTNISSGNDMSTYTWEPYNLNLGGIHGLGRYYAGTAGTGGAAMRGGSYSMTTNAGVYNLNVSPNSSSSYATTSFRCVNVIDP